MTLLRRLPAVGPLFGFALLLLLPGLAIRAGVLASEFRFPVLLAVAALCIGLCVYVGYSSSELGLNAPRALRHWYGSGLLTALLALSVVLETYFVAAAHQTPPSLGFAPFYVLVSSPCQEVVCRSIPKLMTDRLQMGGPMYVLYSATIFSLMHSGYGDPVLLANTFVAGLVWAIAYLKMRNIWPLIASHAAIGTLAFSVGLA